MPDFRIEGLTFDERLDLLDQIWESLQKPGEPPPIPDWHREVLRARIAAADANPGSGISLEDLRRELKGPTP